ncbi:MAG: glycosyltransferase family 2 protein [Pirellulales bacterium]|nr:glycosyltransferase family 2 protein [Pirellulales bacterium]
MYQAALILFWILLVLAVAQGILVIRFVIALWRWRRELISDSHAPKAAVILCLRGGDPFLVDCISGLLGQDYPNYQIHVVIDHVDDPAHAILDSVLQQHAGAKITVHFLEPSLDTCSLKCASLVQTVQSLDESYQFVAQLDADTIPHPGWLRELATALADPNVGAATGNRWYMPDQPSIGSMIRYVWNAAAVVQMHAYNIAWGGTLAVKTHVLRETELLEQWGRAFCEDTMLFEFLKQRRLRLAVK